MRHTDRCQHEEFGRTLTADPQPVVAYDACHDPDASAPFWPRIGEWHQSLFRPRGGERGQTL